MTQMDRNGNLGNICDEIPNSHGPELEGALNVREGRNGLCPPDTAFFPGLGVLWTCCPVVRARAAKESQQAAHLIFRPAGIGQITSPL